MRAENLFKQYGGRTVLNIPLLEIRDNTRLAVLGPNGSGKSTLLKILAGVIENGGEKIELENFGYLPQQSYAFDKTVLKNAELALWDIPKAERREKAEKALAVTGLLSLKNASAKTLSGGETQRLALSRVLARENGILLLDEPTAACDMESETLIENALRSFKGTVIFSTHSPAQALRLGDSAVFLENGEIIEKGFVCDVIHSPKSDRVKKYMSHWRFDL